MRNNINIRKVFRPVVLTLTAIAVVIPTACCRHEVPAENAILMSARQDETTRAVINEKNDLGRQSVSDGAGFGVYGYKTANYNVVGEEIETQVFSNTKVTATGSDDNYNWSYSPLKYWDAVTYYRFVAYWPHTSETPSADEEYVSHNETNHIITLRNLPCWQEVDSSENDWLISTSRKYASQYITQDNGYVRFHFQHLLARIEIKAWYWGREEKKPEITELNIGNSTYKVPADTAKTTVSRDYATALSSNSWGSITYANSMKLADTTLINAYSDYEDEAPENIDLVCEWLVVPFSATGCPLTLRYKIDGVSFDPVTLDASLGAIESGKKYTLIFKFNTVTNSLVLEELLVKDWVDSGNFNKDVHNW